MAKNTPKKSAKTEKKESSSILKTAAKAVGKGLEGAVTKALGGKSPIPQDVKAAKGPKKEKAKKTKKAKSDEFEADDLVGDDDMGSEEIPDLSDFDANEEAGDDEAALEQALAEAQARSGPDDEVVLTDAEGRRYCRVRDCDQVSTVEGYCRFHYLLLWKKIQIRRKILVDGKLERYVEELTSRYPDKFLEMIRKDLRNEKDFLAAIAELEIDESAIDNEFEDEAQNYIDEVRGMSETSSSMGEEQDDSF